MKLLLALICFFATAAADEPKIVAMGNLAVVFNTRTVISTDHHPLHAHAANLWCQATVNGNPQPIEWARFVRTSDRKIFEADPAMLENEKDKAVLVVGSVPATDAAKYRCEIKTLGGDLVFGNLFVYSRPVIHSNGSIKLDASESDPFTVIGSSISANEEGSVQITCPAFGFPTPSLMWYFNGEPLEFNDRVTREENVVTITELQKTDEGVYRCTAANEFPPKVDDPITRFEAHLDQKLKVSSAWGWVYPLIVIIVTLLLLFCIIWSCAAWKNYKADQYNVAKREKLISSKDIAHPDYDIEKK